MIIQKRKQSLFVKTRKKGFARIDKLNDTKTQYNIAQCYVIVSVFSSSLGLMRVDVTLSEKFSQLW